ncbi:MAG: hypothetical protein KC800_14915 [Candidatus Eremiobacteraeota bacterium]|nr:hypothetical protein [Candidatus Eremiobacteraeota bacterium]
MRRLLLLLALLLCTVGCSTTETYYGKVGTTTLSFELPKEWKESGRNQWTKGGKQLVLGEVRVAAEDSSSLEERAKKYESRHSTHQLDSFEEVTLAGQTAYLVEYTWGFKNRRKQGGYVYWADGNHDVVLHHLNGNFDPAILDHAVETLSFGVEQPAVQQKKQKPRTKTPPIVYHLGFLLLFCGLPGAVGGALSYSSPGANREEYLQAVSQGTRLPAFLGTLVGCGALGIFAFSEIVSHFQPRGNQLAYILLVFMIGAAIFGAFVVSFVAGRMAGAGARRGAVRGRFGAALGGALGAVLGAIVLPIILSLM